MNNPGLFAPRYFSEISKNFHLADVVELEAKQERIQAWQTSIKNKTILQDNEIQLQTDFLNLFFRDVLDYAPKIGNDTWNLDSEFSVSTGKRADGYLGYFTPQDRDIRVVIELKDARVDLDRKQNRKDSQTPVEQAFSYAHKVGSSCKWVILSNFLEIRLYPAGDSNRYERFDLMTLHEEDNLKRFLFLLNKDRLILKSGESHTERHFRQRQEAEAKISNDFYKDFKQLRLDLFTHLQKENPQVEELTLFNKAQKILDRLIFVLFCEDKNMLPYKITKQVLQAGQQGFTLGDEGIWQQLKGLFHSIDKGNPTRNINRYNGGLFAADPVLDRLSIKNDMMQALLHLESYDFESDLNVNILGHIFEQSISDIEEIKAEIAGEGIDKKQGKRKKDGIFYTPEYITRYIVQEAVGGWLNDRQKELGVDELPELDESDYQSTRRIQSGDKKGRIEGNKKIEQHRAFWTSYKEKLSNIKVVDPACGSGAFLVQVFDFLYLEGQTVNRELARLSLGQTEAFDLDKHILSNNIYGVDLNAESVEITKLSLWLKTADARKELTALDENIQCGNSLIDDPAVAGDLAFDWEKRFPGVFDKGGFDAVVGNPPYVDVKMLGNSIKSFLFKNYSSATNRINLYSSFIERAYQITADKGFISFIVPNSLLLNSSYESTRNILWEGLLEIVKLPDNIFPQATVETILFVSQKSETYNNVKSLIYSNKQIIKSIDRDLLKPIDKAIWENNRTFNLFLTNEISRLLYKCSLDSTLMQSLTEFSLGLTPYDKYSGHTEELIKNRGFHSNIKIDDTYKPLITGENINRFFIDNKVSEYISYGDWLSRPRETRFFSGPRIIVRQIISGKPPRIFAGYTEEELFFTHVGFTFKLQETTTIPLKFILGVLNSNLINFFHKYSFLDIEKDTFQKILIANCKQIPIKNVSIDSQNSLTEEVEKIILLVNSLKKDEKRFFQLMISEFPTIGNNRLLEKPLSLTSSIFFKELKKAQVSLSLKQKSEWMEYFEEEKAKAQTLQAEIDQTDREIDRMVYELYGLTEEEIRIVEGE